MRPRRLIAALLLACALTAAGCGTREQPTQGNDGGPAGPLNPPKPQESITGTTTTDGH